MESFINFLSNNLGVSILKYEPVSGGDISKTFSIKTSEQDFFLKINSDSNALAMFESEQNGLKAIAQTQTIKTPKIIDWGKFNSAAYLLMEYIPSKVPSESDFKIFGTQLAHLHFSSTDNFGFDKDNFIGSLPQSNEIHNDWATFYVKERLMPQFKLALENNLLNKNEVPEVASIIKVLDDFCKDTKPALLHGDLWSGNFLIASSGEPYLIDPAVYFGHNEVDIAMAQLFGGFPPIFYEAYHMIIPKSNHHNSCIELYQLYYLLVHLNLFGSSYYHSVKRMLKRYF